MKKIAGILFYFTLTICFSCEEQGWFVKCSDCEINEPEKASLEVKLEKVDTPVKINVYEGELEDSVLYFSTIYSSTEYTFNAILNKKYTLTATYFINGSTYIAVDSAIPHVKYVKDQCDEACYFVYDKILDLRIKYLAPENK